MLGVPKRDDFGKAPAIQSLGPQNARRDNNFSYRKQWSASPVLYRLYKHCWREGAETVRRWTERRMIWG